MPDNIDLLWGEEANLPSSATKGAIYVTTDTGEAYIDVSEDIADRVKLGPKAGSEIVMTGYSKPSSSSDVNTTDTVNQAVGKVEKKVDDITAASIGAVAVNYTVSSTALNSVPAIAWGDTVPTEAPSTGVGTIFMKLV